MLDQQQSEKDPVQKQPGSPPPSHDPHPHANGRSPPAKTLPQSQTSPHLASSPRPPQPHLHSTSLDSPLAMPQYTSRDVGDPSQMRKNKQSMADLKLRRLTELNTRLREDLDRERIPVSQAARSIIAYCNSTRDYMVPSVWGVVPKGEDPYAPQQSGGCCTVM
ncbi:hypothetical protein GQ53DRAFT_754819 [Thozetella sp. PMI_491]|nr:hypothetical protein GQ53DRAFT_754819 [Thozetella sp. PMI_491]